MPSNGRVRGLKSLRHLKTKKAPDHSGAFLLCPVTDPKSGLESFILHMRAGTKEIDRACVSGDRPGSVRAARFERRFSPGRQLDGGTLQPGDTLLGRQVMFLTFNESGSIESCHVVATTGDARPDYDCDEVRKEQFRAQANTGPGARQAFMTILAYGHQELIA